MSDHEGTSPNPDETRQSIIEAHGRGVAALRDVSNQLEEKLARPPDGTEDSDWRFYIDDLRIHLNEVIARLDRDLDEKNAEEIAQDALQAVQDLEQRDFVYHNLREALKHSQHTDFDGAQTVRHFEEIDLPIGNAQSSKELDTTVAARSFPGTGKLKSWWGKLLNNLESSMKQAVLWAIQIATNALKLLSKFAGIKPVVGFSGPLPSVSFMIEAQAVNMYDVFDVLSKGLK